MGWSTFLECVEKGNRERLRYQPVKTDKSKEGSFMNDCNVGQWLKFLMLFFFLKFAYLLLLYTNYYLVNEIK